MCPGAALQGGASGCVEIAGWSANGRSRKKMTITTGLPVSLPENGGAPTSVAPMPAPPTIWGLDPVQLHDRFWAHRGVQVVRQGEGASAVLSDKAQLFLLTEDRVLAAIDSAKSFETLYWSSPDLVYVRVRERRDRGYKERVITDEADRFVRFERVYDRARPRLTRAAFTPSAEIARAWQKASDGPEGWRALRRLVAVAGPRPACSGVFGVIAKQVRRCG